MPVYLEPKDVSTELEDFNSVLIVSCPVCPPMCLAMQRKSPFIEFFKRGLKTGAFEDYIQALRDPLEQRGVRTGVYSMHIPVPMMCLWTGGQHKRLLARARDYEAVLVLGCDSATYTAREALKNAGCQVIQAMQMTGIANATVNFGFPMSVHLDMHLVPKKTGTRRHKTREGGGTGTERNLDHSPV